MSGSASSGRAAGPASGRRAVCRAQISPRRPSRGAGGRALFAENPQAYVRFQPDGVPQHPRGLPPQRRRASAVCVVVVGLRRQYADAVLGAQNVDHPLSLYAATKKANELMAHTYAHTVRPAGDGPALLHGVRALGPARHGDVDVRRRRSCAGRPIKLFNHGNMRRDFTYVDDIVEAMVRLVTARRRAIRAGPAMRPDPATSRAPYRIYNIGNNNPVELMNLVASARGGARPQGRQGTAADAAGRRAGHLCRRQRLDGHGRLPALHAHRASACSVSSTGSRYTSSAIPPEPLPRRVERGARTRSAPGQSGPIAETEPQV